MCGLEAIRRDEDKPQGCRHVKPPLWRSITTPINSSSNTNNLSFMQSYLTLNKVNSSYHCVHCRFSLRDSMHKRCLCRHAVSVCPSVTFVYSVKTSYRVSLNVFTAGQPHHSSFPHQTLRWYSDENPTCIPPTAGGVWKISLFSTNISLRVLSTVRPSDCLHLQTMASWWHSSVAFVDRGRRTTKHHASVNLVCDRKPRHYAEDNRTEFNCTRWEIWSLSN